MAGMLDEADFIARYDRSGALGQIGRQLDLPHADPEVPGEVSARGFRNLVVMATGWEALAAEFALDWLGERQRVPVQIVQRGKLPGYVGKDTLVIAETPSGLEAARRVSARSVTLPGHVVPRLGAISGVLAWGMVFEAFGWGEGLTDELRASAEVVRKACAEWSPSVPTHANEAKQIAQELLGHPVVVYSGPAMRAPALKWKADLNEAAHQLAFSGEMPGITGWEMPRQHGMKVVELRSNLDDERANQRFELANRRLSNRFAPIELRPEGSRLDQMLWAWMLGSYVSGYLGVLNRIEQK